MERFKKYKILIVLVGIVFATVFFWRIGVPAIKCWDDPLSCGNSVEYFSLNDPKATYYVRKEQNGTYSIEYNIGKGYSWGSDPNVDDTRRVAIGSSKISLDQFVDKKVIITGQFRQKLGKPLCWKDCDLGLGNDSKGNFILIDIDDLKFL